tara:strand:+ start:795 stop:1223 length:429 start_codon:yes stop_codon:yes gene_type:complete
MTQIDTQGLFILNGKEIVPYTINDEKMILCGVPGAFTYGCTTRHLPGFANNLSQLKSKGIHKVAFMSVNDAIVMNEWNKLHGHKDIDSVSDPLAVFSKRIKKDVDWGETFGTRCNRFAFLIEKGKVIKEFKDPFIEGVLAEL